MRRGLVLRCRSRRDRHTPRHPVLELRIHGVHGTSPQSMLGVTQGEIGQVTGDSITGIYRTKTGAIPLRDLPDNVVVEAYSWGALTSRVTNALQWIVRVLWLALLPFALLNLSYWARGALGWRHEAPGDKHRMHMNARFGAGLVRLAALLMTAFFTLTPVTVGVDMVAWQCYRGGANGCSVMPSAMDFLTTPAWRAPQHRILVGTVVPILVIVILGLLSLQSVGRYEAVKEPATAASAASASVLCHPRLWHGGGRVVRLRNLHLVVAIFVVVGYSGAPEIFKQTGLFSVRHNWGALGIGLIDAASAVVAIIAGAEAVRSDPDDVDNDPRPGQAKSRRSWLLLVVASLLLICHEMCLAWLPFGAIDDSQGLKGENIAFILVFVLLTAAHIGIMLTGGRMSRLRVYAAMMTVLVLAFCSSRYIDKNWRPFPHWLLVLGYAGTAIGVVALIIRYYRQDAPAEAWSGAAASVFLGGAIWIALLFTTSAVIPIANELNGPNAGVGDIVTTNSMLASPAQTDVYRAVGDVQIRHGIVARTRGGYRLVSGTITLTSLLAQEGPDADPTLVQSAERNVDGAHLAIPSGSTVSYLDSCVPAPGTTRPDPDCSPVSGDLTRSGSLPLASGAMLWLGDGSRGVEIRPTSPPQVQMMLPQVLVWAPIAEVAWLLGMIAITIASALSMRKRFRDAIQSQVELDGISPEFGPMCTNARLGAAYTHRLEVIVGRIGILTSTLSIIAILGMTTGDAPWQLSYLAWTRSLATLSLWISLGTSAALVWLASKMRKSDDARKSVGILWDLTTFWPRAAHPFAPPCYAERVVPEVIGRIRWALDDLPGSTRDPLDSQTLVIVSGHSQGSAIAVAAVSRLSNDDLARVRLITYGSQLRAWYGRVFPGVFGAAALGYEPTRGPAGSRDPYPDVQSPTIATARPPMPPGSLLERMTSGTRESTDRPAWVNLFRRTDPIGFHVFSDDDDGVPSICPDIYVREIPPPADGDSGPRVNRHSWYQHTPEYITALRKWTGEDALDIPGPRIRAQSLHPEP